MLRQNLVRVAVKTPGSMLDKWAADGMITSSLPLIRSWIVPEAATGVPWSSSPTMISVGSEMTGRRSVKSSA
jgi:hypothetical protein